MSQDIQINDLNDSQPGLSGERGSPAAAPPSRRHRQHIVDEILNSITHGVGLLLSVSALTLMVAVAVRRGTGAHLAGAIVFGVSLVLLYLASTLYHSFQNPSVKRVFRHIDHSCIYLLIAGTYTPFTLVLFPQPWGWILFGSVWGLAALGITVKWVFRHDSHHFSTVCYILMGWLAIIAIKPMLASLPLGALVWIAAGGLAYTVGVIFYALDHIPFFHPTWHLFVLGGSTCHFFAVMFYVLP